MKAFFIAALALASFSAFARPDTTKMSCAQAQDLVETNGAITLSVGNQGIYDRFVAHAGLCSDFAVTAWVRTADESKCAIGYACTSHRGMNGQVYTGIISKCKEGATASMPVSGVRSSNGREFNAVHTCVNGKWTSRYTQTTKPSYAGCKEGRRGFVQVEANFGRERFIDVPAICKNGRYVRI